MAIRTIITEPNKLLRQISKPVNGVGKEERKLMDDMLETMYDANGIGLAAIQVGVPKRIIVMDISKDALGLARRYLKSLAPKANVKFSLGDWWEPLLRWWGSFDLVLSNPPYIPSDLIENLEPVVKNHEPLIALDGGKDGMIASNKIIFGALLGLAKGGWLILEHHYDQSEKITSFMKNIGMEEVSFEKDLSGIKRYAICRKK